MKTMVVTTQYTSPNLEKQWWVEFNTGDEKIWIKETHNKIEVPENLMDESAQIKYAFDKANKIDNLHWSIFHQYVDDIII